MSYFEPKTYELQSENQPWSYATDGVSQRFEVRSGDNWVWDNAAKERSEIASYKKMAFDQTYTVSYRFMVEPGAPNTADWLLIGQVHQTEDAGEMGISPPLAIEMAGERLRIVVRSNPDPLSTWANTSTKTLWTDTADLERGRWYDMRLEVRFNPFGNGELNVWRDGQQIVSYDGAIGYNDQVGTYWKQGVYREASAETFAVNFANLAITEGKDALSGTISDDVLSGDATANRLQSYAGADTIFSGLGDDVADGGAGNDLLFGGQGADSLYGGDDADQLYGSQGDDLLSGDSGDDQAYGGVGRDTVSGGSGNDLVASGLGDDVLYGGDGDDRVWSGAGNDIAYGGAGNDLIYGSAGNDRFYGEGGADTFIFEPGWGVDEIMDFSYASGDRINLRGQSYGIRDTAEGMALDLSGGGSILLHGIEPVGFSTAFLV